MHVFISWSGERSRAVAEVFREWIPMILQSVEVWMSASDMEKGARWGAQIAAKLDEAEMGIVCLTPENMDQAWILFEAGAISKHMNSARVCTYLIGLRPQDMVPPLSLFQHTVATTEDTKALLQSMNGMLEKPLAPGIVDQLFEATWPSIESRLTEIAKQEVMAPPRRSLDDMVAELLDLSRSRSGVLGVETVLGKLQYIELALFILSYRSVGYSQFEELAFGLLKSSQRLYPGDEPVNKGLERTWGIFDKLVEDNKIRKAAAASLKAREEEMTVAPPPAEGG